MQSRVQNSLEYIASRLGRLYINKTLDNFRGESAVLAKNAFESGMSVYIFGECGKGKTHLLSALAHLVLDRSFTIVKSERINEVASFYGDERRFNIISTWKHTPILFIDDIGVGKLTEERSQVYYKVLDYRASNGKQTVYTSNVRTDALWNDSIHADPARVVRRIRENCEGIAV